MGQNLDGDLLLEIHDVARLIRVEADKRARQIGMTRAQWVILLRLARTPGVSQRELADILDVEPITVARVVDRLAANGLVERRADEQDRRVWRLHLLPAAQGLMSSIQKIREELASDVMSDIPPAVQSVMLTGLQHIRRNLLQAPPAQNFKESA